jgi:hypothetical protein
MSADIKTDGNDDGLAGLFVGLWFWVRGVPDSPEATDKLANYQRGDGESDG